MTDVERIQALIGDLAKLLKKLPEDELFDLIRGINMEEPSGDNSD